MNFPAMSSVSLGFMAGIGLKGKKVLVALSTTCVRALENYNRRRRLCNRRRRLCNRRLRLYNRCRRLCFSCRQRQDYDRLLATFRTVARKPFCLRQYPQGRDLGTKASLIQSQGDKVRAKLPEFSNLGVNDTDLSNYLFIFVA